MLPQIFSVDTILELPNDSVPKLATLSLDLPAEGDVYVLGRARGTPRFLVFLIQRIQNSRNEISNICELC